MTKKSYLTFYINSCIKESNIKAAFIHDINKMKIDESNLKDQLTTGPRFLKYDSLIFGFSVTCLLVVQSIIINTRLITFFKVKHKTVYTGKKSKRMRIRTLCNKFN